MAGPSFSFSAPGATPAGATPAGSGPARRRDVTVRGRVHAGTERGCVVLVAEDGRTYQVLGGDPDVVRVGRTLEVLGTLDPDLRTTGQQGTPLLVRSARPTP